MVKHACLPIQRNEPNHKSFGRYLLVLLLGIKDLFNHREFLGLGQTKNRGVICFVPSSETARFGRFLEVLDDLFQCQWRFVNIAGSRDMFEDVGLGLYGGISGEDSAETPERRGHSV